LGANLTPAVAGFSPGPSDSSGDGVSDGSDFSDVSDAHSPGPFGADESQGPAPNSGDGTPDGSGMDSSEAADGK
jgi:hypothetical protein